MVPGAEGAVVDQRRIRGELVGDRVDAGYIQRLVDGHARRQRLAGAGRADHQHVVDNHQVHSA